MEGIAMTMGTTTAPFPRSQRPARRNSLIALALVGVGVVALAVVFVGSRRGDDVATSTSEAPIPAAPASVRAPSRSYTVYLTDSAEHATALAQDLAALTPATGEPVPGEVLTLAAGSLEEQSRAQQMIGMLEDVTNGRAVHVIDVRRPAPAAQSGAGGGCESGLGYGASDVSGC